MRIETRKHYEQIGERLNALADLREQALSVDGAARVLHSIVSVHRAQARLSDTLAGRTNAASQRVAEEMTDLLRTIDHETAALEEARRDWEINEMNGPKALQEQG